MRIFTVFSVSVVYLVVFLNLGIFASRNRRDTGKSAFTQRITDHAAIDRRKNDDDVLLTDDSTTTSSITESTAESTIPGITSIGTTTIEITTGYTTTTEPTTINVITTDSTTTETTQESTTETTTAPITTKETTTPELSTTTDTTTDSTIIDTTTGDPSTEITTTESTPDTGSTESTTTEISTTTESSTSDFTIETTSASPSPTNTVSTTSDYSTTDSTTQTPTAEPTLDTASTTSENSTPDSSTTEITSTDKTTEITTVTEPTTTGSSTPDSTTEMTSTDTTTEITTTESTTNTFYTTTDISTPDSTTTESTTFESTPETTTPESTTETVSTTTDISTTDSTTTESTISESTPETSTTESTITTTDISTSDSTTTVSTTSESTPEISTTESTTETISTTTSISTPDSTTSESTAETTTTKSTIETVSTTTDISSTDSTTSESTSETTTTEPTIETVSTTTDISTDSTTSESTAETTTIEPTIETVSTTTDISSTDSTTSESTAETTTTEPTIETVSTTTDISSTDSTTSESTAETTTTESTVVTESTTTDISTPGSITTTETDFTTTVSTTETMTTQPSPTPTDTTTTEDPVTTEEPIFLNCTEEDVPQTVNGEPVTFKWSIEQNQIDYQALAFASTPPCLNANMTFAKRYCHGDKWSLAPTCYGVQKDVPKCPENFNGLIVEDDNITRNLCYRFTPAAPWPPNCPLQDEMDTFMEHFFKYAGNFLGGMVWFPVARNLTHGFGPLQSIGFRYYSHINDLYGNITVTNKTSFKEQNCVGYYQINQEQSHLEYVDCNSRLPSLCFYNESTQLYHPTLKIYHNRLLDDKIAYYVNDSGGVMLPRVEFCETFAEPKSKYALTTLNAEYDNYYYYYKTCWFGLERSQYGTFVWSKDQDLIEYTNWHIDTNFSNPYGAITKNLEWKLNEDFAYGCAFCQKSVAYKTPVLELTYNYTQGLVLKFFNKFKDHNDVICYSNTINLITNLYLVEHQREVDYVEYFVEVLYSGQYWCTTFHPIDGKLISSNTVLVTFTMFLNEYSLHATVKHPFDEEPTKNLDKYSNHLIDILPIILLNETNPDWILRVVFIKEINETVKTMDVILHLNIPIFNNVSEVEEYSILKKVIDSLSPDDYFEAYGSLLRNDVCLETTYVADNGQNITWNTTALGSYSDPFQMCLVNGAPPRRKCSGSFIYGASWEPFSDNCDTTEDVSDISDELYDLLSSNLTVEEVVENVLNLTKDASVISSMDVNIITTILERITLEEENSNVDGSLAIASKLMDSNVTALYEAQKFNSTDRILDIIDEAILKQIPANNGILNVSTTNIVTQIVDVGVVENITGIALVSSKNTGNGFDDFEVRYLTTEDTAGSLTNIAGLEMAVLIPKSLLTELKSNAEDSRLVVSSFFKDSLFNDRNKSSTVSSRTIGVLLPGLKDSSNLSEPITVLFRTLYATNSSQMNQCSFWRYGFDAENQVPLQGSWASEGSAEMETTSQLYSCNFEHLTHFGLLVSDMPFSETDTLVLTIVTAITVGLSLLGILGIFITALIFKTWRSDKGHQILLQLCLVALLQYVLFYLATADSVLAPENDRLLDFDPNPSTFCIIVGYALYFTILSQFCWMLVIATLQYRRFVVIFKPEPDHVMLKAALVGWVLPLVPIAILTAVNPDIEIKNQSICYPGGISLWLGILLPVVIIIVVNTTLFSLIIYSLASRKALLNSGRNVNLRIAIIRLSVFLFFILGLSWIFGIMGAAGFGIVFVYLFCATAPLQGLVLFLYFIVLSDETKNLWYKMIGPLKCWPRAGYDMPQKTSAELDVTSVSEAVNSNHKHQH